MMIDALRLNIQTLDENYLVLEIPSLDHPFHFFLRESVDEIRSIFEDIPKVPLANHPFV